MTCPDAMAETSVREALAIALLTSHWSKCSRKQLLYYRYYQFTGTLDEVSITAELLCPLRVLCLAVNPPGFPQGLI